MRITSFPLHELPSEILAIILQPIVTPRYLKWLFTFLSISKGCFAVFPYFIASLFDEGIHTIIDRNGHINGVHYKNVLRYLTPQITSLDMLSYVNECVIKGDLLTTLCNLRELSLENMFDINVEHLQCLPLLTHLDLSHNIPPPSLAPVNLHLLTGLKNLNLSRNASIHDNELRQMTNLIALSLSNNNTITFEGIKTLTQLERIDITGSLLIGYGLTPIDLPHTSVYNHTHNNKMD